MVALLSDGDVARWIPVLPQPYSAAIADGWIRRRTDWAQQRPEICFAIRDPAGEMVGSVGVDDFRRPSQHDGELGYWLGAAERGRGLATRAVAAFIPYAFGGLGLARLTAHTLVFNARSVRVLEKNGFLLEGCLRRRTRTATGDHDTLVFGLLRDP
jgi:RimJ/RimL family protein N-acetyltransferase